MKSSVLILLTLFSINMVAQDVHLHCGKIIDTDSKESLDSVKITIIDSTTNAKDLQLTNKLGDFELHIHKNNIYYLIIEKRNYFTKTIILNIGDSNPGGKGCVRDVLEQTMRVQNKWINDDSYSW